MANSYRSSLFLTIAAAVFAALGFASGARAASSAGAVRGKVLDPNGAPMPGVPVVLHNDITGFSAETRTASDGSFELFNVPFNPYRLEVSVEGFQPVRQQLDVRSAVTPEVTVTLRLAGLSETMTVEAAAGQMETDTSTSHVDLDKSYIERAPATVASRAMEELVTATPGFAKDENGRYHFQGFHSQSEFVIDGQTISDQTGVTFSNSIDPEIAQSMEVIYGNVPAEYGEKVGAVVDLATKSGLRTPFHGDLVGGGARFGTYEGGLSLGGGSRTFGAYASFNASTSDRFLDPVNPDGLHNQGDTQRAFLRLDYAAPDLRDLVRLTVLVGHTHRDVPNTYTQQEAGQDQQVRSRDQNLNLGWTHIFSPKATLDTNAFARFSHFDLTPSPGDTPVQALSDRSLDNYGLNLALNWVPDSHHQVKVGGTVKRFPIDEHFAFGITDPDLNDPDSPDYNPDLAPYDLSRGGTLFDFRASRTGTYAAAYLQDDVRLGNLTAEPRPPLRPQRPAHHREPARAPHRPRLLPAGDQDGAQGHLQPDLRDARVREHPGRLLGAGRRSGAAGGQGLA